MKKNILPILIIVILLVASSFLFWKGEVVMKKASENYTMIYFENTENQSTKSKEDLDKNLSFSIENTKKEAIKKELALLINNKEVVKKTINLEGGETKTIIPSEEIITEAQNLNQKSFVFQVRDDKNNEGFELTKKIFLK